MDAPRYQMQTQIHAKFIPVNPDEPLDPKQQAHLAALNAHAEDVCGRIQTIFQDLIIEMLDLKRNPGIKIKEENDEGSSDPEIPSGQ